MNVRRTGNRSPGQSVVVGIVLIASVVLAANLASAGQEAQGSIIGLVADESGAVLPGVTVTVSSPALQVKQIVDVTDVRGEYRVTALPLGTYDVDFTLQGFQALRREHVRLTTGFVAKIDVVLKVGTVSETLRVVGQAPIVDVTSTTTGVNQLTREFLDTVPTGNIGIISLMSLAPGARTNLDFGTINGQGGGFRSFGRNNNGWTLVDGVPTTATWTNSNGRNNYIVNTDAIEETTVQSMSGSAEIPTSGIQLSVITKSGSNTFHGGASVMQFGKWMQTDNIDDALVAQGISSFQASERWDRSFELGGRILRDKLWFYTSGRARKYAKPVAGVFLPDGSPANEPDRAAYSTNSLTAQLSPSQRLIGTFLYADQVRAAKDLEPGVAYESRGYQAPAATTGKGEWQLARGNTVISAQVGWFDASFGDVTRGFTTAPATVDDQTDEITGLSLAASEGDDTGRIDVRATINWYKPGLFKGNHNFKAGYNFNHAWQDDYTVDRGAAGNYQLVFQDGEPSEIRIRNNPVAPKDRFHYTALFLEDSWTVRRRLTLNFGVRYSHDRAYLPAQCRVAAPSPFETLYPAQCFPYRELKTWNSFVPRLHAAFDLTGDGKTVIKGGWGRFVTRHGNDELALANDNFDQTSTFQWTDRNGDKLFQPGEVNLDPQGPDFVSKELRGGDGASLFGLIENPNEKQSGSDEFVVSLERQLIPDLSLRVTGVFWRDFNTRRAENTLRPYSAYNIPITNLDPGPDGDLGTADDTGQFITYYDYPAALAGEAFQRPWFINDPNSDANSKTIEIAVNKRLSNRWQLMASYSATKLDTPFVPDLLEATTPPITTFNPNAEINAANRTWDWQTLIAGSYILPADVQLSARYENRSGDAWARTVEVEGGEQIPSFELRVEPIGTRRLPSWNFLSLAAEKGFRLGGTHRIIARLRLFNVLNINNTIPAQPGRDFEFRTKSGGRFLQPKEIVPPRWAEFSVRYSF